MTQEEKAKAYDEALERMKSWAKGEHPECFTEAQKAAEFIFPELAESEDERIRKVLVELVKCNERCGYFMINNITTSAMLAWLEKPSQKSTSEIIKEYFANTPKEQLDKDWEEFKHLNDVGIIIDEYNEPKFHEGDWVVCEITGSVYQIKNCIENLNNHRYGYDLIDGGYIGSDEVNHYHLWTIQDAKDGDVLASKNGDTILIFRNLDNNICFSSYYNTAGMGELGWSNNRFIPATKKQRDLLFQKMKEAGYEWDANKKELKKFHVIDEGKAEMDYCFTKMMNGEKVSSAWSEEDEKI